MRIKYSLFFNILILIIVCLASLYIGRKSHYYSNNIRSFYFNERNTMLKRQATQIKTCDILMIGDSLVEGMFYQSDTSSIVLMGVGGSKVSDWRHWTPKIFSELKAKKLIIAIGVNDSARHISFNIKTFIDNYKKLCATAKEYGIENIYISSVLPVGKNQALGDEVFDSKVIKEINSVLKNLAHTFGYSYIDAYSRFVDDEGFMPESLTSDGVHLNDMGYRIWKEILF